MRSRALVFFLLAGCAAQPAPKPVVPTAPDVVVPVDHQTRDSRGRSDPKLSPEEARQAALERGPDPAAPQSQNDEPHENIWGDSIGDAFGAGGLGLRGTGPGGGGTGEGIGLGSIGTIGKGDGTGYGSGRGRRASSSIKDGAQSVVEGSLDKGIIRRVVRARFGAFRACYQAELKKKPDLGGRLRVRFVIDGEGRVSEASAESQVHADLDACVLAVFKSMRFPDPHDGGIVVVRYPLVFSPGDNK